MHHDSQDTACTGVFNALPIVPHAANILKANRHGRKSPLLVLLTITITFFQS